MYPDTPVVRDCLAARLELAALLDRAVGGILDALAAGVPITGELRAARRAGTLPAGAAWFARTTLPAEELYDVAADPDELHDLAADPAHAADLVRLRAALVIWMRDTKDVNLLPEPILRREAREAGSE